MIIKQYPAGIVKTSKLRLLFCESCGAREELMVKMISKERNIYIRNHRNGIETERPVTEERIYWLCFSDFEKAMPGQIDNLKKLYKEDEDIFCVKGANSPAAHS